MKPVTLVRMVVVRKVVFHGDRREPMKPEITTKPVKMPTRLMMTCKMVNAASIVAR